jgi:hypothetical protein
MAGWANAARVEPVVQRLVAVDVVHHLVHALRRRLQAVERPIDAGGHSQRVADEARKIPESLHPDASRRAARAAELRRLALAIRLRMWVG